MILFLRWTSGPFPIRSHGWITQFVMLRRPTEPHTPQGLRLGIWTSTKLQHIINQATLWEETGTTIPTDGFWTDYTVTSSRMVTVDISQLNTAQYSFCACFQDNTTRELPPGASGESTPRMQKDWLKSLDVFWKCDQLALVFTKIFNIWPQPASLKLTFIWNMSNMFWRKHNHCLDYVHWQHFFHGWIFKNYV